MYASNSLVCWVNFVERTLSIRFAPKFSDILYRGRWGDCRGMGEAETGYGQREARCPIQTISVHWGKKGTGKRAKKGKTILSILI
jgi:hypothetical protein